MKRFYSNTCELGIDIFRLAKDLLEEIIKTEDFTNEKLNSACVFSSKVKTKTI